MRQQMRATSVVVLPDPAGATHSTGPGGAIAAARWSGASRPSRSRTDSGRSLVACIPRGWRVPLTGHVCGGYPALKRSRRMDVRCGGSRALGVAAHQMGESDRSDAAVAASTQARHGSPRLTQAMGGFGVGWSKPVELIHGVGRATAPLRRRSQLAPPRDGSRHRAVGRATAPPVAQLAPPGAQLGPPTVRPTDFHDQRTSSVPIERQGRRSWP